MVGAGSTVSSPQRIDSTTAGEGTGALGGGVGVVEGVGPVVVGLVGLVGFEAAG